MKHWPVCGSYPVQCPNKCSNETMERQILESHVTNDCPLTVVDCDFKGVGCEIRLPRKDLSTHHTESLVAHVLLQTKRLMDLEIENKQLKQQVEKLKVVPKVLHHHMTMQPTISKLQQQVEMLTKDLWEYQTKTSLCPQQLTMTNFEQHKKDGDEWHSPPFYSHPKGYKMCLVVYAGGNGDGANTHVSVFLKLMKGEYDEELKWPLIGKFKIQLLSQNEDERHITGEITFDTGISAIACSRVVDGEQYKTGLGFRKFIPHTELKPTYLQNDCLKFNIKKGDYM